MTVTLLSWTSEKIADVPACDFGVTDEQGRNLGYSATIMRRTYEARGAMSGRIASGIVQDGATTFVGHTYATRDGKPFGPSTKEIECSTLEEVEKEIAKRRESARKRCVRNVS
jgi:hypothetical protein